jgi:protein-disulfide isomerase
MKPERILEGLTALFVLGALCIGGLAIAREVFPDRFRTGESGAAAATHERWLHEPGLIEQLAATGWRIGEAQDSTAVAIIEFADFQCPSCRETAAALRQVLEEHPGRVILAFHHYPLESIHPHAFAAGVAFECAAEQGQGKQMHDALYEGQDEIGTLPWTEYATGAGVPDSVRFKACLAGAAAPARVRNDARMARALGLRGTPTLVIGRVQVFGTVGLDSLRALVRTAGSS